MSNPAYTITFTDDEIDTIQFVGDRYEWSNALQQCYIPETETGTYVLELSEPEAWELCDAFERDTEGGHSYFPMLALDSDLYAKLLHFIDNVV